MRNLTKPLTVADTADDPEITRETDRAAALTARFNNIAAEDHAGRFAILRELLGRIGDGSLIRPPLRCDYGYQTHIGAHFFANWGLILLDVARITIGDDVQVGPNVQLLTATHPTEPGPRPEPVAACAATVLDEVTYG